MIDLSQELIFSLISRAFFTGVIFGGLYELVRMAKMLLGIDYSGKERINIRLVNIMAVIFTFVTDIVFCLLMTSSALLLTYNMSGGVFRGSVYVSMLSGFLIYHFTIGRLVLKIEVKIIKLFKRICKRLLLIIIIPIRAIFSLLVKLYDLTIGKIFSKIKGRVREKKAQREERRKGSSEAEPVDGEEAKKDVCKTQGYRKEGRISFGGPRVP